MNFLKRGEDLARRCENKGCLTSTGFLTPAEQYALAHDAELRFSRMVFRGGHEDFERGMAFFLPDYMEEAELIESEHIRAIKLTAAFGEPAHRDYMGAVLGMGVNREWVGGYHRRRVYGIRAVSAERAAPPAEYRQGGALRRACGGDRALGLPHKARQSEERSFTLMSLRLDALCSGMFRISRTEAVRQIAAGNVSLNYTECLKGDRSVKEGDIVSLRGAGRAGSRNWAAAQERPPVCDG